MRKLNTSHTLNHLMLRLIFEIHLPRQCSIIGELGQIGIDDALLGIMISISFVVFVMVYDVKLRYLLLFSCTMS